MNPRFCLSPFLLLTGLILPLVPHAQDQSDGTLHVLRPTINAEQESAELCLEFDHALDHTDSGRLITGIRLELNGKNVLLNLTNISVAGNSLCFQSLQHKQDYRLSVTGLRGANGEKLTEAYKLSFTVPDRHATLAFAGDANRGRLLRIRDNDPVLRAINVAQVKAKLFKITDPAKMAQAYHERALTTLAPSESLTFAKDNAQLIWQDEVTLDDPENSKSANRNLEHPVPLHAAVNPLTPGFYLITAEDVAQPTKTEKTVNMAPIAAQWFIHSNLKIHVIRRKDGFSVETQKAENPSLDENVRLLLFDRDLKTLAETKSDAHGLAFFSLPPDKIGNVQIIAGLTEEGDVDLIDLSTDETSQNQFKIMDIEAGLSASRSHYAPGDEAYLALTARTIGGEAIKMSGSSIQLLRPDRSLYTVVPVPDGKAGVQYVALTVPPVNGQWIAVWQQADGRVLAETTLRVTTNTMAPRIIITADRPLIGEDGDLNLSIKSTTNNGGAAPFVAGQIWVQWTQPDHFAGWNDYRFGKAENNNQQPFLTVTFITDGTGAAKIHLNTKPPDDGAALHTAVISVRTDAVSGALDPDSLSIPVRSNNYIVGIKPLASEGRFAENSLARFEIIVLDGEGARHEDSGLKYQIYEEGRSFDWYQAEGRWSYKPLQQRRRLGGGSLDIKASGVNNIRWPVTAGAYLLEVTDTNGVPLSRLPFSAGWGSAKPESSKPLDLALASNVSFLQSKSSARIKFKLEHASIISVIVADDRIRQIIHEIRNAGDNEITVTPEENWGNRIRIRVEAEQQTDQGQAPFTGQIELPVRHQAKELGISIDVPDHIAGGQELMLPITLNNIEKKQPTFINVLATPVSDEPVSSVVIRDVEISQSKALVRFTLPSFTGDLRLTVIASNRNQWGQKELSIPVRAIFYAGMKLPTHLQSGDTLHSVLFLENNGASGPYHYFLNTGTGLKMAGAVEGKINFPAHAQKPVYFDLLALEAGEKNLKLDITGPQNFHISRNWPLNVQAIGMVPDDVTNAQINPQQNWTFASGGKKITGKKSQEKSKPETALLLIAPQPLFDTPKLLPVLMTMAPFTTEEISSWLEAVRLWQSAIAKYILPDPALKEKQRTMLERLLVRQKPDGGFPILPGGESDLVSTAQALIALVRADQSFTRPAADAATGWLRQRLSNTWFDEEERSARATAFAALAATDRLDVASLRYFAETSDGKTLPPLASACLSAALAKSNDNDKGGKWLGSIRDQLASSPSLWPAVAENPLFNPQDLMPVLEKYSAGFVSYLPNDPQGLMAFLRAAAIIIARAGTWHVEIDGVQKSQSGVLVTVPPIKSTPITIHNSMDRPLYVSAIGKMKPLSPGDSSITRRIYQTDGSERTGTELRQEMVYVVVLEGTVAAGDKQSDLFIHDEAGNALKSLSCAVVSETGSPEVWAWLKNLSLTPVSACEAGDFGIDAALTVAAEGGKWRVAYLAKTDQAGTFNLLPPLAHRQDGNDWSSGNRQQLTIK